MNNRRQLAGGSLAESSRQSAVRLKTVD